MLSEAEWVFVGFLLCISGVQGDKSTICILKGSSVDLNCSAQHPASSVSWYTIHKNITTFLQEKLVADGKNSTYNRGNSNFTLTISDVKESDAKFYCCSEDPRSCWQNRTELYVADVQVKVFPATEGRTVKLMCDTSCRLTENPAAYIWYRNTEFLYENWSPWYQELVSSDEAVRYSCAVKGYERIRAPEVSVDSVTPSCLSVTYAGGRMCSCNQTSQAESCSIVYPTEVHVQKNPRNKSVTLTCNTSCHTVNLHTGYMWYWNRKLYSNCRSHDITVHSVSAEIFSCAVESNEDLHSDEICLLTDNCWSVNYVKRRICAVEGSAVNIISEYRHPNYQTSYQLWYKKKRSGEENDGVEVLLEAAGRVEYHNNTKEQHTLRIKNLTRTDSAEYRLKLKHFDGECQQSDSPGVLLVVTGLKVTMLPSAEVTEGQRVTLSCSTSCPLNNNTPYIWYLNTRPLPEKQNKHLVLDPVRTQHAGNYTCSVKNSPSLSSPVEALTVIARGKPVLIMNVIKLIVLLLTPSAVLLFYLKMRKKKTVAATAELGGQVQLEQEEQVYEDIRLMKMNPAAWKLGRQQKDTV